MKKTILRGLLVASALVASPVLAQSSAPTNLDPLSSDEAWEAAINAGKTDVEFLGRKEIAPGIFPKRQEMQSLDRYNCFVGGDVISSDRKIAAMIAAGRQCTDDFRKEVNGRKKAGSTTFYVHQSMFGYAIRIDKRGSSEQGNSTCDAFSPFGSSDPIAFACFNDMNGHQRVMGFATALGHTAAAGAVNFGLMRSQRRNKTIIDNRSGSASGSESESEATGGGGAPTIIYNNPSATAGAGVYFRDCPTTTTTCK